MRRQLGRRRYDRLMKALSIVYGIEPYVVLKDIWGSADREVEEIAGWVVDAMIDAALREAGDGKLTKQRALAVADAADGRSTASSRRAPSVQRGRGECRLARLVAPPLEMQQPACPSAEGMRVECQNPKLLSPGWSSGRRPSGQWYLRSASAIGCSLMLAMRRCIRPPASNSQFSLP